MVKPETRLSVVAPHGAGLTAGNMTQKLHRSDSAFSRRQVVIVDGSGDLGHILPAAGICNAHLATLSPQALWAAAGLVLLQNRVQEPANLAVARQARKRGIPVLLNATPHRGLGSEFASLVDILVVNAATAECMGAPPVTNLVTAAIAAEALAARFSAVVVTCGSFGLAAWSDLDEAFCVPAEKVDSVCRQGVGDAFTTALAAAIATGNQFQTACEVASRAAATHLSGAGGTPARKSLELVKAKRLIVV